MKEQFQVKRFSPSSEKLLAVIDDILRTYEKAGYDLSLRQLYYQLVSRNVVPNTEKSYKSVGSLVSDARMAGLIDWGMIRDRGREHLSLPHWVSPADFMESVIPQYHIDLWRGQAEYVEVMVEKQALEGVLVPVCQRYDVGFTANKGYTSSSALYEAGLRYRNAAFHDRNLFVIYLGDHDPSGIDMSRDVEERLSVFARADVRVERVALNMDQIEQYNPPKNPAKLSDTRAVSYVNQFGTASWELDALEPSVLAGIVKDAILRHLIVEKFAARKRKRDEDRETMSAWASKEQSGDGDE